jgi:hypothetical protein
MVVAASGIQSVIEGPQTRLILFVEKADTGTYTDRYIDSSYIRIGKIDRHIGSCEVGISKYKLMYLVDTISADMLAIGCCPALPQTML